MAPDLSAARADIGSGRSSAVESIERSFAATLLPACRQAFTRTTFEIAADTARRLDRLAAAGAPSIPCRAAGEMPVGLMLWSTALRDDALLDAALAIESALAAGNA